MKQKSELLALDSEDVRLKCPLSGVSVNGKAYVDHLMTTIRVCFRFKKKKKSIFAVCPIHNLQMFLNDEALVEEIIHESLAEVKIPRWPAPRDPR